MKSEYIPKVITLLAGVVVCIISIAKHMDTTYSLKILLATLIIFYIIGSVAGKIIDNVRESDRVTKIGDMAVEAENQEADASEMENKDNSANDTGEEK